MQPHLARLMLACALISCAVTIIVGGLFDPFGREANRADYAARRATGVNLCISEAAFRARLEGVNRLPRPLSPSDQNLIIVLQDGLARMATARDELNISCPGPLNSTGPTQESSP